MKKNAKNIFVICTLSIINCFSAIRAEEKNNPESYWSAENAPVFYGATKITIKKGLVDDFDLKDARFRIFAKDFEDGDLTASITSAGAVDANTAGSYNIEYEVADSHGNISKITVPVTITEDEDAKINVERTLYTIPSVWNMSQVGVNRCNSGDRQILGIYMPAGSAIRARALEASSNVTVAFLANDSKCESSGTLNKDGNWVDLQNLNGGTSYDCVPLFTSAIMDKGVSLDTTFKVEIEYDGSVKELNYYHQGDDEAAFRADWQASGNAYSVIENEVVTVVVPLADINMLTNYYAKSFKSLDQFLEYWQKVVDKMDEMIGLELNPTDITDQNVRTKYLVKANASGAGAAYYAGNHVGVNSKSVAAFFEMNWGGLHEFAHGYQGDLGKGQMELNEVANNILGHYIQINKDIYFYDDDWLGTLSSIEESKNEGRLAGNTFTENDVGTRLYALINLFDSFEGEETYAKMFKWYRAQVNGGKSMSNQDAYVLSIADIYNVNIIPYMEAWGLTISDGAKSQVYEKNYPMMSILKDIVPDENALDEILASENIAVKYGLVTNETLQKYDVAGNLAININIDDISKAKGKVLQIKSGGTVVETAKIEGAQVGITDLPSGTYYVQMPVLEGYNQGYLYVQVKAQADNVYDYTYEKQEDTDYNNYVSIKMLGTYYETTGFEAIFSEGYKKLALKPNAASMSGKESIKVYDAQGNLVFSDTSDYDNAGKGGNYFHFNLGNQAININTGYRIEITYPDKYASKVKFYSTLTGAQLADYAATAATTNYIVTDGGLRREDMTEEQAESVAYNTLKQTLIDIIEAYKVKATEEELSNKLINFKEKGEVVSAYEKLKAEDRNAYDGLVSAIRKGGLPQISVIGRTEYNAGDGIDLYSLISAYDNEDATIEINGSTTVVETTLDATKAGLYAVLYKVSDSDGNVTAETVQIKILGSDAPTGLAGVAPTTGSTSKYDGKVTGLDANSDYEYSSDGGKTWESVSGTDELTGLFPGTYYVRYAATATHAASEYAIVVVPAFSYGADDEDIELYRPVYIPVVDGVTTDPVAGYHYVSGHENFTFTAVFADGNVQKVFATGYYSKKTLELEPELLDDGSYQYTLRQVTEPWEITFGAAPGSSDVGTEAVAETKIWAYGNALHISVASETEAAIYSITGALVKTLRIPAGEAAETLNRGVYIVKAGGKTAKVVIR